MHYCKERLFTRTAAEKGNGLIAAKKIFTKRLVVFNFFVFFIFATSRYATLGALEEGRVELDNPIFISV